jgi:Recombinase
MKQTPNQLLLSEEDLEIASPTFGGAHRSVPGGAPIGRRGIGHGRAFHTPAPTALRFLIPSRVTRGAWDRPGDKSKRLPSFFPRAEDSSGRYESKSKLLEQLSKSLFADALHIWLREEGIELPVKSRQGEAHGVVWRLPAYNIVHNILTNPIYAGAYAFGRTKSRVSLEGGRNALCHEPTWS